MAYESQPWMDRWTTAVFVITEPGQPLEGGKLNEKASVLSCTLTLPLKRYNFVLFSSFQKIKTFALLADCFRIAQEEYQIDSS